MSVGILPIKAVTPPSDIAALFKVKGASGKLDPKLLVSIGPSGQLHHTAARAYNALAFLCLGINLPLTYTYGGTYRNFTDQYRGFFDSYQLTPIKNAKTKVYLGKTYYLKPGHSTKATPGDSNHGWGLAIDTAFDSDVRDGIGPDDAAGITGHPQWLQFKLFAVACGFSWETVPEEPWHIRYVTGDAIPQQVLDVENFIARLNAGTLPPAPAEPTPPPAVPQVPVDPTPAPQPTPTTASNWTENIVNTLPTLKAWDTGGQVRILQGLLVAHGAQNTPVTDAFGGDTDLFVKKFQIMKGLTPDGIVGPQTWARLIQA